MSKHTPGPWRAECRHISYKGGEWGRDEFLQWEVYGPDEPPGRGAFYQGDALLIAAAPDLLGALQELDKRLQLAVTHGLTAAEAYDSFFQDVVESAIAKATGAE